MNSALVASTCASKEIPVFRSGMMTEAEAIAFEADPLLPLYIMLRNWDDYAKKEHIPLPSLDHYRQMMEQHLLAQIK